MNPCPHFSAHSSVTGLDPEGTCLTCDTAWSLEDIRRAVKRANSIVTALCHYCEASHQLNCDDVYVLTGAGHVLVYDCPGCSNEVYAPVCPEAAAALNAACVLFTNVRPITRREQKAYEITLWGAADLVELARMGMAS